MKGFAIVSVLLIGVLAFAGLIYFDYLSSLSFQKRIEMLANIDNSLLLLEWSNHSLFKALNYSFVHTQHELFKENLKPILDENHRVDSNNIPYVRYDNEIYLPNSLEVAIARMINVLKNATVEKYNEYANQIPFSNYGISLIFNEVRTNFEGGRSLYRQTIRTIPFLQTIQMKIENDYITSEVNEEHKVRFPSPLSSFIYTIHQTFVASSPIKQIIQKSIQELPDSCKSIVYEEENVDSCNINTQEIFEATSSGCLVTLKNKIKNKIDKLNYFVFPENSYELEASILDRKINVELSSSSSCYIVDDWTDINQSCVVSCDFKYKANADILYNLSVKDFKLFVYDENKLSFVNYKPGVQFRVRNSYAS